jgi:hypothetical protein
MLRNVLYCVLNVSCERFFEIGIRYIRSLQIAAKLHCHLGRRHFSHARAEVIYRRSDINSHNIRKNIKAHLYLFGLVSRDVTGDVGRR